MRHLIGKRSPKYANPKKFGQGFPSKEEQFIRKLSPRSRYACSPKKEREWLQWYQNMMSKCMFVCVNECMWRMCVWEYVHVCECVCLNIFYFMCGHVYVSQSMYECVWVIFAFLFNALVSAWYVINISILSVRHEQVNYLPSGVE